MYWNCSSKALGYLANTHSQYAKRDLDSSFLADMGPLIPGLFFFSSVKPSNNVCTIIWEKQINTPDLRIPGDSCFLNTHYFSFILAFYLNNNYNVIIIFRLLVWVVCILYKHMEGYKPINKCVNEFELWAQSKFL